MRGSTPVSISVVMVMLSLSDQFPLRGINEMLCSRSVWDVFQHQIKNKHSNKFPFYPGSLHFFPPHVILLFNAMKNNFHFANTISQKTKEENNQKK